LIIEDLALHGKAGLYAGFTARLARITCMRRVHTLFCVCATPPLFT
jgi:hypothetical protein